MASETQDNENNQETHEYDQLNKEKFYCKCEISDQNKGKLFIWFLIIVSYIINITLIVVSPHDVLLIYPIVMLFNTVCFQIVMHINDYDERTGNNNSNLCMNLMVITICMMFLMFIPDVIILIILMTRTNSSSSNDNTIDTITHHHNTSIFDYSIFAFDKSSPTFIYAMILLSIKIFTIIISFFLNNFEKIKIVFRSFLSMIICCECGFKKDQEDEKNSEENSTQNV